MRHLVAGVLAVGLLLLGSVLPAGAQVRGAQRRYPAGWNLVAAPPGTDLSAAIALSTLQSGDTSYEPVSPGGTTSAGLGYWAYLPTQLVAVQAGDGALLFQDQNAYSARIRLAAGSDNPVTIDLPAGQTLLIGNPSGRYPATVQGADTVLVYDPLNGYQPVSQLAPGQGAMVASLDGGTVTITPNASVAASVGLNGPPVDLVLIARAPAPTQSAASPLQPIPIATIATSVSVPQFDAPVWPEPFFPSPLSATYPTSVLLSQPVPLAPPTLYPYPLGSSQPIVAPFVCPGDVITSFALRFCNTLADGPA